jgi:hypothetical protein
VSEDKRRLEDIVKELSVDDVLLMARIVSMYIEKVYRARSQLQRAMSILGVTRPSSEREMLQDIVVNIVREEIARRFGGAGAMQMGLQEREEEEISEETYQKLRSVLEKVKKIERGEEKPKNYSVHLLAVFSSPSIFSFSFLYISRSERSSLCTRLTASANESITLP